MAPILRETQGKIQRKNNDVIDDVRDDVIDDVTNGVMYKRVCPPYLYV